MKKRIFLREYFIIVFLFVMMVALFFISQLSTHSNAKQFKKIKEQLAKF